MDIVILKYIGLFWKSIL